MTEKIKNWLLPLLFGSSIAYMVIKCYHNTDAFALSLLFIVYELVVFTVFDLIRKLKRGKILVYMLLSSAVMYVSLVNAMRTSFSGAAGLHFNQWFYGAQTANTKVLAYSVALIAGGGYFIISILYYFTQVIYRSFGTMLILFFPLVIYAKRQDPIDDKDMLIILAFYMAVMVHNRQMRSEKDLVVMFNPSYIFSVGTFVTAAIIITALFPKPEVVSIQEQDSSFFDNFANAAESANAPDDYSNRSSLSGGDLSDDIIMTVTTMGGSHRSMYLRRQSYDVYYDGGWYLDQQLENAYKIPNDPEFYNTSITNTSLIAALSDYAKRSDGKFKYPDVSVNSDTASVYSVYIVMEDDYSSWFPPVPLNTITIDDTTYRRCMHGEYRPPETSEYRPFKGVSFKYMPPPDDLDEICEQLDLTMEETLAALEDAMALEEEGSDRYYLYRYLYNEEKFAYDSFGTNTARGPEYSDEVKELAEKITSGLSTPYQKAKALEGYFTEENFEYDPEYTPIDPSVEYFLKTSKRGACGDFATAMTLMARAVGLKARYVEGFVSAEVREQNYGGTIFTVREKHSHAYTEVYIPGAGWVVFEPTVAGFMEYSQNTGTGMGQYLTMLLKYIVPAALAAVLIFIFRKPISELIFKLRVRAASDNKAVLLLYNRIASKMSRKKGLNAKVTSPGQVRKLLSDSQIDADDFVDSFERACYGSVPAGKEEKKRQYSEYLRINRQVRKLNDG